MTKKTCCVCGHLLNIHIDEKKGWRCHALGRDGYQCECFLRRTEYHDAIGSYDLVDRTARHVGELRGGKT